MELRRLIERMTEAVYPLNFPPLTDGAESRTVRVLYRCVSTNDLHELAEMVSDGCTVAEYAAKLILGFPDLREQGERVRVDLPLLSKIAAYQVATLVSAIHTLTFHDRRYCGGVELKPKEGETLELTEVVYEKVGVDVAVVEDEKLRDETLHLAHRPIGRDLWQELVALPKEGELPLVTRQLLLLDLRASGDSITDKGKPVYKLTAEHLATLGQPVQQMIADAITANLRIIPLAGEVKARGDAQEQNDSNKEPEPGTAQASAAGSGGTE
jgi:hypothetical protein